MFPKGFGWGKQVTLKSPETSPGFREFQMDRDQGLCSFSSKLFEQNGFLDKKAMYDVTRISKLFLNCLKFGNARLVKNSSSIKCP